MFSIKEHGNKAVTMHILGKNFGFLQTALLKAVYFEMHCSVTTN